MDLAGNAAPLGQCVSSCTTSQFSDVIEQKLDYK